jgi:hypothetical protein
MLRKMQYTIEQTEKYTLNLNLNADHICIGLSGGADSAILLWILCNIITRDKLDIGVSVYRVVNPERPWHEIRSNMVMEFIKKDFPEIVWEDIITEKPDSLDNNEYVDLQGKSSHALRMKYKSMVSYSGVTLNPTNEIGELIWKDIWKDRSPNRNHERYKHWLPEVNKKVAYGMECKPFCIYDKRAVLAFYKKYDLLDTLLPITRTCEGWKEWTNNFTEECKQCWWCLERNWAIADARGIKNWDPVEAGFHNTFPMPKPNPGIYWQWMWYKNNAKK